MSSKVKLFFQLLAKKRKLNPFYLREGGGGADDGDCSFHMPALVTAFHNTGKRECIYIHSVWNLLLGQ